MEHTKWILEPDSLGKYGVHNIVTDKGELITSLPPEDKANAQLIVSAVNACIKLNPDNPQAVSESISDLYEACKAFQGAMAIWQQDPSKSPNTLTTIFNETIGKALAKADEK